MNEGKIENLLGELGDALAGPVNRALVRCVDGLFEWAEQSSPAYGHLLEAE